MRVVVNTSDGIIRTWEDKTLCDSFISFNSSFMGENQLCYASGKIAPVTYKHPSKIRNSGDKGKLISANDSSGFTYRGRFADKEETSAVSYEYSQKVHNALRWLIEKQGDPLDSMTVVVWASALQEVPALKNRLIEDDDPIFDEDEESEPTTAPGFMAMLKKRIFGYREKLEPNTKVMIMGT